jgi:hypothetical protein
MMVGIGLLLIWVVWLLIYLYTTVYVPGWQREQAALIEDAIRRDCRIAYSVPPASVPLTIRPVWQRIYPPTGRDLVCRLNVRSGEWQCTDCAGGP